MGSIRRIAVSAGLVIVWLMSIGSLRDAHAVCMQIVACGAPPAPCSTATGRHKMDDGCEISLGGRNLVIPNNSTLDLDGGSLRINALNFTIASGGWVDGPGKGGLLEVEAVGDILVELSAGKGISIRDPNSGGTVSLTAGRNVTIDGNIRVNAAAELASGGAIEISAGSNIVIKSTSDVDARGGTSGCGGTVSLDAGRDITVEAKGPAFFGIRSAGIDGGEVELEAGGNINLLGAIGNNGQLDGSGGAVFIASFDGNIDIGAAIQNRGSAATIGGFVSSGDGGEVEIITDSGEIIVRADIIVRGGSPEGAGGTVGMEGKRVNIQAGLIDASSGTLSCGGVIDVVGREDVTLGPTATVNAGGGDFGGALLVLAGHNATINGFIDVGGAVPGSSSGEVQIIGGSEADAQGGGDVAVNNRIDAAGAGCVESACSAAGIILVNGCNVTIGNAGKLDASAPGGSGFGGAVEVTARGQLTVHGDVLATGQGQVGSVLFVHPSGTPPVFGLGGIRSPSGNRVACDVGMCGIESACTSLCTEPCGCGNGNLDQFEECDGQLRGSCGAGEVCGPTGLGADEGSRACECLDTCLGDGQIDPGEQCDGPLGGGASCRTLGYASGDLGCVDCGFDTSPCVAGQCNDGVVAPIRGEVCDGTDLAGATCRSRGYSRGTLRCAPDCMGFDESGCEDGFCGDGTLDLGEECDNGTRNSNAPNATCRLNCVRGGCGDGILDGATEACDDGSGNGDDRRCLADCSVAICGDGHVCTAQGCTTGPNRGPEACEFGADICCTSTCAVRTCAGNVVCGSAGSNGCCQPASCDDGNICTIDACKVFEGCSHTPVPNCCTTSADCDDGNACTGDTCNAGNRCEHATVSGPCDDGNACTVDDTCVGRECRGAARACEDEVGACQTLAGCDAATGCQIDFIVGCCASAGQECNDGDACTGTAGRRDRCNDALECIGGDTLACDDGNICTRDSCDAVAGCQAAAVDGCCTSDADCDDASVCTTESCDVARNTCVVAPVACQVTDECAVAVGCNPVAGCLFARLSGVAGLTCLASRELAALDAGIGANTGVKQKTRKKLLKTLKKARKAIQKAVKLAAKPGTAKKAASQLKKAGKWMKKVVGPLRKADRKNTVGAAELLSQAEVIQSEVTVARNELRR
jgi:hypothetical protein